ncbi:glycosyltransferase [Geomonas sp. RF6]|uniref:glycosyltransferase family 2 protein n=1 Tax=Geomonas sp. RF6 TaxID=2897342 RepID=UPI001E2D4032|nr:glycosyltransferase [Geomonas sp. RF6]UFS69112.1 glycosyltransferase [Geomonas sp. RF6]
MSRISVIIPAYNAAATIARAVHSVLRQELAPYEVIVVDDGSQDGTSRLVEERFADRVRLVRQANAGPAAARNRGIKEATAEYIAFLDADDEWHPGKLQIQLAAFSANPAAGLCFTDMSHWENDEEVHVSYLHERGFRHVSGGAIYENLLHECFVFTPSVVIPRVILERVGGFNECLRIAEDYDLWLRIAHDYNFIFIDQPLLRRHRNAQNITNNLLLYAEDSLSMMEQLLTRQKGNARHEAIIRKRLSIMHNDAGYHCRRKGMMSLARQHYLKSLSRCLNLISARGLLATIYHDIFWKSRS